MVILNTCHIREKASEKVFSELGRLRQLKERVADQQGRQMTIAVAGCVAQAEGEELPDVPLGLTLSLDHNYHRCLNWWAD